MAMERKAGSHLKTAQGKQIKLCNAAVLTDLLQNFRSFLGYDDFGNVR